MGSFAVIFQLFCILFVDLIHLTYDGSAYSKLHHFMLFDDLWMLLIWCLKTTGVKLYWWVHHRRQHESSEEYLVETFDHLTEFQTKTG